jgi:hypothetical protein
MQLELISGEIELLLELQMSPVMENMDSNKAGNGNGNVLIKQMR